MAPTSPVRSLQVDESTILRDRKHGTAHVVVNLQLVGDLNRVAGEFATDRIEPLAHEGSAPPHQQPS